LALGRRNLEVDLHSRHARRIGQLNRRPRRVRAEGGRPQQRAVRIDLDVDDRRGDLPGARQQREAPPARIGPAARTASRRIGQI